MKNFLLISTLLFPFSIASAANDAPKGPQGSPDITVAAQPESDPAASGALVSFRQAQTPLFKDAETISKRLFSRSSSLEAESEITLKPSPDGTKWRFLGSSDPSASIEISITTGDISYNRGFKGYEVAGETPGLPKGQEAVRTALRHLNDLNLLPGNPAEITIDHIGGMRMAEVSEEGLTSDVQKLTTVHFGRKIGGLPVGGPGSKIIVHLGREGELVGLHRRWTELDMESHAAKDFLAAPEVAELIKGKARSEWNSADEVSVEMPVLGLFDDGQGRIEPAFFAKVSARYSHTVDLSQGITVLPAMRTPKARFQQEEPALVQPTTPEGIAEDQLDD
jgi:hypothetical protein